MLGLTMLNGMGFVWVGMVRGLAREGEEVNICVCVLISAGVMGGSGE